MADDTLKVIVPEPHYTLFDGTRGGLPEVLVVNDALLSFAHLDIFPWHLRVKLSVEALAENGMPTSEESQVLFVLTPT